MDSNFVVAEWRDAGGVFDLLRTIAPLHLHHNDDEAWYVLGGSLCVRRGEEIVQASAGSAVFGPRGFPHTYWNRGPGPLRYLLVMTANIYQLITDIHAVPEKTRAALKEVFRKLDSELL